MCDSHGSGRPTSPQVSRAKALPWGTAGSLGRASYRCTRKGCPATPCTLPGSSSTYRARQAGAQGGSCMTNPLQAIRVSPSLQVPACRQYPPEWGC